MKRQRQGRSHGGGTSRPMYAAAFVITAVTFLFSAIGFASHHNMKPVVDVAHSSELGNYLVGNTGMTLYLFTKDENGKSNCSGGCADNWPPLSVSDRDDFVTPKGLAGEFDLITRQDGKLHVTYNGSPLYYWVGDKNPGDTTGHGVGSVWFVVAP